MKKEATLRDVLKYLRKRRSAMVRLLREMVEMESPSGDKEKVDRCAARVAAEFRRRDAKVQIIRNGRAGNIVRAEILAGRSQQKQLLILGHVDTVYPVGTIKQMPFRVKSGRAWGPGTFDMKGGLVMALFAVEALLRLRMNPERQLVFLWTGDEEVGSKESRKWIEREARKSSAVLVLEPSLGSDGRVKTRRKGVGEVEIVVRGRAAHAGINPAEGINAVHELALQVSRLMKWNDPRRGITVQANVLAAGTATNVVPDAARALVDVRFERRSDSRLLERRLLGLRPILKGARVIVRGGINRPPLERTAKVAKLLQQAHVLARELGFELGEGSTGGASDGNLTAAMGVPTLDGLGAVGEGAHSPRECVVIRELAPRAALLAGLMMRL